MTDVSQLSRAPPARPAVIEVAAKTPDYGKHTHLYAILRQLRLHGQSLARVDVRIVGLVEGLLELFHLIAGENGPAAAVARPKWRRARNGGVSLAAFSELCEKLKISSLRKRGSSPSGLPSHYSIAGRCWLARLSRPSSRPTQ